MQTLISPPTDVSTQTTTHPTTQHMTQRRKRIIYWTLTLIMFLPATAGAFVEAFTNGPASIVKIMIALGYPLYLMKIRGVAKIFGGIAILTGKLPKMKEWAYAGFAFDFLGATASHLITGEVGYALFPFAFFLVLLVSYTLWDKTAATPLPFGQGRSRA